MGIRRSDIDKEIQSVHQGIKKAFSKIKEEMNEHLDAINSNTNEIQMNYEHMFELENKIDKIASKLEEIELHLGMKKKVDVKRGISLSIREQEVFLVIYTSPEPLRPKEIARRIGLTEDLVNNYVDSIMRKGVPLVKKLLNGDVIVTIDQQYKALQAQENVFNINESIARHF